MKHTIVLFALVGVGLTPLRSPKDAATQTKTTVTAIAPSILPKTPKPFHLSFTWDTIPGAYYKLYAGTALTNFTRSFTRTNNFATVSNLYHGTGYAFAVTSLTNGLESDYSAPVYWPQPRTNFLSLGVSMTATGAWTTNATFVEPPPRFYRLKRLTNGYSLQVSTNLWSWTVEASWPATNPPLTFYLRHRHWDNVTGVEKPD